MEQIMNDYGEIYKMKNNLSVQSKDDVLSLNNNFEMEENQSDLECFGFFHDNFDFKSDLDSEHDKVLSNLSQGVSSPFDPDNTSIQQSSCICVKCQKDIGISQESCAKFWQKDSKITLCFNNNPWNSTLCVKQDNEQDCNPIKFNFDLPDFSQNYGFEIKQIDEELKYIDEWVNSLVVNEAHQDEKDIEINQSRLHEENEYLPKVSEQKIQNSITIEPESMISNTKSNCEINQDAAFYSWSRNQAFCKALGEKVDENATLSKGTSDKKFNALSIRRSCFRAFSAYYKGTFSKFNRAWQEKKRNKKKTRDMGELIDTYIRQEFKGLIDNLKEEFLTELRNVLVAILHSHRYKKEEEFTRYIDFSIIRDVLYSYTLDARDRFIKNPAYALTFHHFFVNGSNEFINSKAQCKSKLYAFELNSLNEEAIIALK